MEIYKDSSQPVEKRVEDLLSRMTLEEKTAQLCGDLPGSFIVNGKVDRDKLREKFSDGLGRFTQYSMVGLVDPAMIARATNDIQSFFVKETRLGIPAALQSENLCGYPAEGGTIFPSMLNVASTWRPSLAEQMSSAIGKESHAVGINSAMSPVVDVSRDPRWGRTYETFGEDPYLISQMGIHYVRGMQRTGVSCIAKHFLGYAETQAGLNTAVTRINPRELYEVFATPFEAAAKEAGLGGMMASYSEIDGLCVGANREIAHKLLRDTMGFQGMLISDGGAVWKMFDYFHLSATYPEAGLLAKKAGLDSEIPVGGAFRSLPDYVRSGQLDESQLDESVRRVLTIKFNCGLFEHPYVEEKRVAESMTTQGKQKMSEKIAAESMILLKNENKTLPLKKGMRLAVIGPHADNLRYPVSGYTYPAYIEMLENSKNAEQAGQISFNGIMDEKKKSELKNESKKEKTASPFDTIFSMFDEEDITGMNDMNTVLRKAGSRSLREVLSDRFEVRYAQGCGILDRSKEGFSEAVEAARQSDAVVMALGGNCGWVNVTGGEGKDRCHLDLPGVQEELLETVAAAGKPVVLILYGPGCFSVGWAQKHVQAIVQAWLPGPYGAQAVADVLDGTVNPGGKLPVTVPRSVGQVPVYYNHRTGSGYASTGDNQFETIFSGGYVDEDNSPLYPFGYGLSYTDFCLSDFSVEEKEVQTDGKIHISCSVSNTGRCSGDEVVQLYTHFNGAHVVRPNKQLAGFVRVSLKEGEKKTVRFTLDTAQLGYYNENMDFVVEPGVLDLMAGTSSRDLLLRGQTMLTGKPVTILGKRSYTCQIAVQ